MKKLILTATLPLVAIAVPSAASAQEAEPFVAITGGYHDLGDADDIEEAFPGVEIDTGSPIFGVVAGVDVPMGESFFIGAEGNYNLGTNAIDSEYGVAARLGYRDAGGAKYYLRTGYQEVEIDFVNTITVPGVELTDADFDGLDDSAGDFLVGAGAEFPLGTSAFVRVNVDTVGFDSARATAGVGLRF